MVLLYLQQWWSKQDTWWILCYRYYHVGDYPSKWVLLWLHAQYRQWLPFWHWRLCMFLGRENIAQVKMILPGFVINKFSPEFTESPLKTISVANLYLPSMDLMGLLTILSMFWTKNGPMPDWLNQFKIIKNLLVLSRFIN